MENNIISLKDIATLPEKEFSKETCNAGLKEFRKSLFKNQNIFYADGRFGLLIVFQGIDTSGKDGTIRKVMSCMNPMGVHVRAFKKPSEEEQRHDFLWRIYPHFPEKSMIEVFNRSYYEDVLVPKVVGSHTEENLQARCMLINELECHLIKSNIHIIKFFLHISKEEQKSRIEQRKDVPNKKWKYDKADSAVQKKWKEYQEAHEMIISLCNDVPWNIIPADKRWYRNYKVAEIVSGYLNSLDLKYPNAKSKTE